MQSEVIETGASRGDAGVVSRVRKEINPPAEMIIGNGLGATGSLGAACKRAPICSFFPGHRPCNLEKLAMRSSWDRRAAPADVSSFVVATLREHLNRNLVPVSVMISRVLQTSGRR